MDKNLKKLILCRVEGFLFDFELTSMMMILGHLLEDSWVVLYSVCSKIQLHNFWVGITWTLHRGGKVFFWSRNNIFLILCTRPTMYHLHLVRVCFCFLFAIFCQNVLTKFCPSCLFYVFAKRLWKTNILGCANLTYHKVESSRPVYHSILDSLGQRWQYISIKFPLHK